MSELKECPFCGGEAVISEFGGPQYLVECQCCDAGTLIGRATKEEAAEDWNTRPPKQDCADEMMATLESILCTIKLGEAQNGNGQLGRYRNSIEQLLAKARGEG